MGVQRTPRAGVGLASGGGSLCGRKEAGPLHSLLPPSGKIWVLQGMGLHKGQSGKMPLASVVWYFLAPFADA